MLLETQDFKDLKDHRENLERVVHLVKRVLLANLVV